MLLEVNLKTGLKMSLSPSFYGTRKDKYGFLLPPDGFQRSLCRYKNILFVVISRRELFFLFICKKLICLPLPTRMEAKKLEIGGVDHLADSKSWSKEVGVLCL